MLPGNKVIDDNLKAGETGNPLFPVFLKLNQLHTVLIGGGNVGLEKLTAILSNSPLAKVTIVSKEFIRDINEFASDNSRITIHKKAFEESDLDGANLVIAATNDSELNKFIRTAAHDRRLLVNVADKPDLCDFYLGSIVKKGDLKIAISTNGKSPTVAKRLKEVLNKGLPNEIDITLQQMSELRNTLSGDFTDKVNRLNEVTASLIAQKKIRRRRTFRQIWLGITLIVLLAVAALWYLSPAFNTYVSDINPVFYYFLGAGFLFALIDGAIGMSYGVTTTSFSLSIGIPPAAASMGVHLSEILSNGIAGWMHYRMGNINWKLFKMLLIPGIIGAVAGAVLLSSLQDYSKFTKPFVSVYTFVLGVVILKKAFKSGVVKSSEKIKKNRFTWPGRRLY